MIKEISEKTKWIDIFCPSLTDLDFLKINFNFHPLIIEELKKPSTRSKVEIYNHYLFIVYYLPEYEYQTRTSCAKEIDFLLTKECLITVRYEKIEPIDKLLKDLERDAEFRERILNKNPGYLLYEILEKGLEFSLRQLVHINEKIKMVEEGIFKGENKKMIQEISFIKRDILDQRLIAKPQKTILESLLLKGPTFLGKEMKIYFNDLLGDYEKIWNALENLKETIESLEDTNNTFFESRLNEIMKVLTIMAFITFPLTLLSSIFSMNVSKTPLADHPYGFWIIIFLMCLLSGLFLLYFKIKKWL